MPSALALIALAVVAVVIWRQRSPALAYTMAGFVALGALADAFGNGYREETPYALGAAGILAVIGLMVGPSFDR